MFAVRVTPLDICQLRKNRNQRVSALMPECAPEGLLVTADNQESISFFFYCPVPVSASGKVVAPACTFSVAEVAPVVAGVKVTVKVQLRPFGTGLAHVPAAVVNEPAEAGITGVIELPE